MKIQLKGNKYLRSYTYGFEIVEFKGIKEDKEGKPVETWGPARNYNSIPHALKGFAEQEIINCNCTTWEGVERRIDETNKLLAEISEKLSFKVE